MGAQFFAAWLADQCACPLSPVLLRVGAHALVTRPGVCRGFSPPSKSQTPATNADFSDLLSQTLPRRFSCSPTRTFPSSPAIKSCPRHPTRHLHALPKLTRRPPADEIPRDLGLLAASCIRPSTVFPRPWQPSQARCTQHRTAPHLAFPPPAIDLIDDRRLPCSSATFVLRRPQDSLFCPLPPALSQRRSDYRISIPR